MTLEVSRRHFQANPSIDSAVKLIADLTRSLANAEDLTAVLNEASARNWNRIWAFLEDHSNQIDSTLIAAINICLEPWPTELRVLPPSHYLRFDKIKAKANATEIMPGLKLIRNTRFSLYPIEPRIGRTKPSHAALFRVCPVLHHAEVQECPEIALSEVVRWNFIPNQMKALKIGHLWNSNGTTERLLANPKLLELETLELRDARIATNALHKIASHGRVRELTIDPGQKPNNPNWLKTILAGPWQHLESLTIYEDCFAEDQFNCQEELNRLPNLKKLWLKSKSQYLSLESSKQFFSLISRDSCFQCFCSAYFNSRQPIGSDHSGIIGQFTHVYLFINNDDMPTVTELSQLKSIQSIDLIIAESATNTTQTPYLLEMLSRLQQANLLHHVKDLGYEYGRVESRTFESKIIEALQSYELLGLESLAIAKFGTISLTETSAFVNAFHSRRLEYFKLTATEFDSQDQTIKVPETLTHLCLNGEYYSTDFVTGLLNSFPAGQIQTLQLNSKAVDVAVILKHPSLRGIKELYLAGSHVDSATDCPEVLNSEIFETLEVLQIVALQSKASEALFSGALPSLIELSLQYVNSRVVEVG